MIKLAMLRLSGTKRTAIIRDHSHNNQRSFFMDLLVAFRPVPTVTLINSAKFRISVMCGKMVSEGIEEHFLKIYLFITYEKAIDA